ncbi:MAG: hypothetical protein GTO45_10910 [Candidatus Aminicenantes bacterium]|nr:hypothetical protein [Candidatus Aminicenantes bacterium]NIN18603.1 hypothetical protein [Candidatus Aminicenantes bacterium]NIN42492.1 hypothetical protein [Candidatus Aminicenantes bacterium]NIN85258.1 hypothetical protein [Candidatus Aminicenantes bacterium]NIO81487.1 hypothetical protein [Candidatus Aminicenantes bacterium]
MAAFLVVLRGRNPGVVQPIPFDHNLHVEGQELECTLCHPQVGTHERAALPANEICEECHSEELTGSKLENQLRGYFTDKNEIRWEKIYRVPDHVYFSHRRHVVSGKIGCESCHGDVKELKVPPRYPLIPPTMAQCMNCHKKHNITNDCLACHR